MKPNWSRSTLTEKPLNHNRPGLPLCISSGLGGPSAFNCKSLSPILYIESIPAVHTEMKVLSNIQTAEDLTLVNSLKPTHGLQKSDLQTTCVIQ